MPPRRAARIAVIALIAAVGVAAARRWRTEKPAPTMRGTWKPV